MTQPVEFSVQNELLNFRLGQKLDFEKYRTERIRELESTSAPPVLLNWFKHWRPNIGIYAGSFNPFHRGHLNILEKAERVFAKVIVAQGTNPNKLDLLRVEIDNVAGLQSRQTERFAGFLTDYMKEKANYADVTLIRGLRNGDDLAYEVNQLRFMQDFWPELQVVFFHCDREYEHLSSTMVRYLKQVDPVATKQRYGV